MKKNEFVKKVTENMREITNDAGEKVFDVTLKETDAYLWAIKEVILEAMNNGEDVTWPGFVKFSVTDQKARVAHNPRTGEAVNVPAKKKVKVKILGELKNCVE